MCGHKQHITPSERSPNFNSLLQMERILFRRPPPPPPSHFRHTARVTSKFDCCCMQRIPEFGSNIASTWPPPLFLRCHAVLLRITVTAGGQPHVEHKPDACVEVEGDVTPTFRTRSLPHFPPIRTRTPCIVLHCGDARGRDTSGACPCRVPFTAHCTWSEPRHVEL